MFFRIHAHPFAQVQFTGLIRGFYSEFSKDIDQLIKLAAQEGAELHTAKYGLENSKQIRSVLANKIRTNPVNPCLI